MANPREDHRREDIFDNAKRKVWRKKLLKKKKNIKIGEKVKTLSIVFYSLHFHSVVDDWQTFDQFVQ